MSNKKSNNGHLLVFYSNRSTPKVTSPGKTVAPKQGWGKEIHRRSATAQEEKTIASGKWLRVDHKGNRPSIQIIKLRHTVRVLEPKGLQDYRKKDIDNV